MNDKQEIARLRAALEPFANTPELVDKGCDEEGNCIMCGFNYKKVKKFAQNALDGIEND